MGPFFGLISEIRPSIYGGLEEREIPEDSALSVREVAIYAGLNGFQLQKFLMTKNALKS